MSSSSAVPQPDKRDIQLSPKKALVDAYRRRVALGRWYGIGSLVYVVFAMILYIKVGRIITGDDGRILVATAFLPPFLAGAAYLWRSVRRVQRIVDGRISFSEVLAAGSSADLAGLPDNDGSPNVEQAMEYRANVFAEGITSRLV